MKHLSPKNQFAYRELSLPQLPLVPCLTTVDEQHYLYWLALHMFESKGCILEIGTWFGCSAGYLAAGLRDAHRTATLYCVDRFESTAPDVVQLTQQGFPSENLKQGQDTQAIVLNHLEKIYKNIVLKKTDIANLNWNLGPIELVHLDAPKRWSDIIHVLKVIEPFLIPRTSVMVVQDFCVPRAYALPLIFGALKDSFKLVHIPSEHSTMAVFAYTKEYVVDSKLDINTWDIPQIFSTWQAITEKFYPQQKLTLELGLASYFYNMGHKEMAALIFDRIKDSF